VGVQEAINDKYLNTAISRNECLNKRLFCFDECKGFHNVPF